MSGPWSRLRRVRELEAPPGLARPPKAGRLISPNTAGEGIGCPLQPGHIAIEVEPIQRRSFR